MTAVVDVHCHVFNADDLPVRGFIHRLHLSKVVLGAGLSELVDRLVQGGAPGYRADMALLDGILGRTDGLEAAPALQPAPPELFEHEVDMAMAELQGSDPDLLLRVGSALAEESSPATAGDESLGDVWRSARRAVRWVKLFGRSRLDLVADLVRNFGDQLDLATPLLVDLGTGLGDVAKTSLEEQMRLFEKLSRASMMGKLPGAGKAHIHPFIGFDPLRELRARRSGDIESPLDLVKKAILTYGFVGVKVYPPMGWRPFGNETRRGVSGDDARDLDDIVDDLAGWCESEDVPITAHCADSNHADPAFKGYGGPQDWLPLLEAHPRLHVNLGHFGGASEHEPDDGWPWVIARATKSREGLYADVGNHRIYDEGLARAYFDMLERMFRDDATAAMAGRLMYGSDWYMVAIHPKNDMFLDTYRRLYTERFGEPETARFMGGNALAFLGLDPANKNGARLLARYERFAPGSVPSWLGA